MEGQALHARIRQYVALIFQRAREGHLPVLRQLAEIVAFAILTGNGPGYYLAAELYRRDIPWRDKRSHLGARAWFARLAVLNPEPSRPFSQNKFVEKSILVMLGVPTPRFVGILRPGLDRRASGQEVQDIAQFRALMSQYRGKRLVFKLLHGWAGQGFMAAKIDDANGELHMVDLRAGGNSSPIPVERFYQMLLTGRGAAGRIVEEYFDQHPEMARFNPSSVNTCRIWAARDRSGPARTLLAYLRIGRVDSLVDNQSAGGIIAPIDLETGVARAANDGLPERTSFECHPDHGARIAGCSIPFWSEAKALTERCATDFPGMRFAGADVAIGPDGPVIIELNTSPGREGAAFVSVPSGLVLPKS